MGFSGCPVNCSGDMYGGVPSTMPWRVSFALAVSSLSSRFAMPKSSTFTKSPFWPFCVSTMFSGFRSRCTMPCSCASCSEPHTCCMMNSARGPFSGARAMMCARLSP